MDMKDLARVLRAHWVGVVSLALLGVLAAAAYSFAQSPVYQATASGFVSTGPNQDSAIGQIGDALAKSRVKSYVDVATSTNTANDVIKQLHLDTTPDALIGRITVIQPVDTVLIKINARAASPTAAQTLANAWVDGLRSEVAKIEGKPGAGQPGLSVVPYASAQLPHAPVLPRTKVNLLLGLILGLALGAAYAVVRHQFDRRLRSPEDVERAFGVPVMATIPLSGDMRGQDGQTLNLSVMEAPSSKGSGASEAFRKLRTNLAFSHVDNPPRIIVVTSPKPGDGKSTIAANLAAAIAYGGQKVTLVDGDLRRPTVARSMGLPEGGGLTDLLAGAVSLEDVVQELPETPGLRIIGAGRIPPNPSELLGSQTMSNLLHKLAEESLVVIDAPPLLPVTDAAVLSRSADGALVVISAGSTVDRELGLALNNLTSVHGTVLGVILNRMSRRNSGGSYYYYYGEKYGYGYESKQAEQSPASEV